MNSTIIVSLLALAGTIFGSLLGAISTSKMLTYRIGQLEDIKDYVKDNCE